ncbi:MAG: SH3 domain-containing protein [Microgenomates group bacterium]
MRLVEKILFVYCTALALFFTVAATVVLFKGNNYVLILFILPIPGYFVYYMVLALAKRRSLPQGSTSRTFILMVILCLCLLTSYAVSKIYIQPNASKSQARWQKLIQPSITPSKNLGHIEVDPEQASDSWVNLRNNPSTEAAVIGKATVGKKYSILVIRSNWIKIQMDASSSAWISKKFIKNTQ